VRTEIDHTMLARVVPEGTVLRDVYTEMHEGKITFGRQVGTYGLLVGVPYELPLNRFVDLKVTSHGQRSLTAVQYPFDVNTATLRAISALPGIGAKRAAAFDLFATCSGSLYSLSVGTQYIRSGQAHTVLAIGAEILSRITDFTDRGTCIILADGAGAAILRPSTDVSEIVDIQLGSNGELWDYLYVEGGGTRYPPSHESVDQKRHYVKMKGNEVFKAAVRTLEEVTAALLDKHGITPEAIDLFIPHQANLRIIQAAARRLGLPMDKVFVNIDRYGNTGAASIYLALDEAVAGGRLKRGDLVLMAAFGGGFTWGAGLMRW